jgi:hypothetical protein
MADNLEKISVWKFYISRRRQRIQRIRKHRKGIKFMARRVSKDDLCSSCLSIRPRMNDGSRGDSIESMLDSVGYKNPEGPSFMNEMLLFYLEDNGGCSDCIRVLKNAR